MFFVCSRFILFSIHYFRNFSNFYVLYRCSIFLKFWSRNVFRIFLVRSYHVTIEIFFLMWVFSLKFSKKIRWRHKNMGLLHARGEKHGLMIFLPFFWILTFSQIFLRKIHLLIEKYPITSKWKMRTFSGFV